MNKNLRRKYQESGGKRLKGWVLAFGECDDISEWETALLYMIKQNAGPWGKKVQHIYETVSGGFEYTFREYSNV